MMESTVPEYTETGSIRERTGSILPKVAPSNVYRTRDGSILIAANQDSVWRRMAGAMQRPHLADDPRFASHHARGEHQQALDQLIEEWSLQFATDPLLALLHEAGVPAGRIYRAPEMLDDPHFEAREALIKVDHPEFSSLWMQNVFPKLSASPGAIAWPGPRLGQHNEEVFGGLLGLGRNEREELAADGVI
jgi:crotonobetainyl-CoA:carnitine CoA-transferase CaiB-like acyl-CoA transferase